MSKMNRIERMRRKECMREGCGVEETIKKKILIGEREEGLERLYETR